VIVDSLASLTCLASPLFFSVPLWFMTPRKGQLG
jgi:hypothetical protein